VADQTFSAEEREAIWLAWSRKCGYTREPIDVSDFHIDHIVPEYLANQPDELARVRAALSLAPDFDLRSYNNLIPCKARANLQKGGNAFDAGRTNFFLGIASAKVAAIEANLIDIRRRGRRGRAIILLRQCLERKELTADEVLRILEAHTDRPEDIFALLLAQKYVDEQEVQAIAKSDIDDLLDRPIWLGTGTEGEGLDLPNANDERVTVRTCNEYRAALAAGYFPYSTYEQRIAGRFEQQLGLLLSLKAAKEPTASFIARPYRGVADLSLLPYTMFPRSGEAGEDAKEGETYQSKVDDGTLMVRRVETGLLRIESIHGLGQQLIEVARADFHGSGFEEILVFESFYATGGTLGGAGVSILSRSSSTGVFEHRAAADA